MNWSEIGHFLTAILAITTMIGGGLVGLMRGSLTTLRDSNGDLRARVQDLESSRVEEAKRLAHLEAENKMLRTIVTGSANWQTLNDQLVGHHDEAKQHWTEQTKALKAQTVLLEKISQDLRRGSG